MKRLLVIRSLLAPCFTVAALACGGGSPAAGGTPTPVPPSPSASFSARTLSVALAPLAGSSYHGSAVITTAQDGYKVTITLAGLTPGSKHLVNFHPGTCDAIDSGNGQDVGFITADASGSGTLDSEYHSPYAVPSAGKVIAIHGDLGTPAAAGHYVCGAMPQ